MRAVIASALRTVRGKGSARGSLHSLRPVGLVGALLEETDRRVPLARELAEDLVLGCVTAVGDQGANIAKTAAMYAGWPDALPGATVNRHCASGLDALIATAAQVASGVCDVALAGGVESMSRVPMMSDRGAWFADRDVARTTRFVAMPAAADILANLEGVSRRELDAYALRSQTLAAGQAAAASRVSIARGEAHLERDETPRRGTTAESLAGLAPLSREDDPGFAHARERYPQLGSFEPRHTLGSAPALADGASLAVLASEQGARRLEVVPRARVIGAAHVSTDPVQMLSGNPAAIERAVSRAGRQVSDIDLFEINESFAVVPITCARRLGVDLDRLNVGGGAIALGHPLGATGGVLLSTLLDELEARDLQTGVVSICGGGGVASAIVVERG